jgi:hypothetical protein
VDIGDSDYDKNRATDCDELQIVDALWKSLKKRGFYETHQ